MCDRIGRIEKLISDLEGRDTWRAIALRFVLEQELQTERRKLLAAEPIELRDR